MSQKSCEYFEKSKGKITSALLIHPRGGKGFCLIVFVKSVRKLVMCREIIYNFREAFCSLIAIKKYIYSMMYQACKEAAAPSVTLPFIGRLAVLE